MDGGGGFDGRFELIAWKNTYTIQILGVEGGSA